MKQKDEKTEEAEKKAEVGNGGKEEAIKKELKEFVEATERFCEEIKGKYGGYEEAFKTAGIDIIKL